MRNSASKDNVGLYINIYIYIYILIRTGGHSIVNKITMTKAKTTMQKHICLVIVSTKRLWRGTINYPEVMIIIRACSKYRRCE